MVADYCNICLHEVFSIDYDDYLYLKREAFISHMAKTETGTEYLKNAYNLEQKDADRAGLRSLQKKLGGGD